MILNFCVKIMEKLTYDPDAIFLGPGFNKDMERFSQSTATDVYGFIGNTKICLDPSLRGKRIRISGEGRERTYNYKTFRKERVEF